MAVRKGGHVHYYFRRSGQPLVKLPGKPGDPEFARRWGELMDGDSKKKRASGTGTLAHLIDTYLTSADYAGLGDRTKVLYRQALDHLREHFGELMCEDVTRSFVYSLRDTYAEKHQGKGNTLIAVLRLLYNFGIRRDMVKHNPCDQVAPLKSGGGHRPWTEAEIQSFLESASRTWRLALLIGMYTGQRRELIVALNWSQWDGECLHFPPHKGGNAVTVPAAPALKTALEEARQEDGPIIRNSYGEPYKLPAFSVGFRAQCEKAGLRGVTYHGLRYTAATLLADAGATDEEIMSVTGHKTKAMVTKYAGKATREKRASNAIRKMVDAGFANHASGLANLPGPK